ncbi:MAG TPA: hypothetical protein VFO73_05295 [Candidatus Limnocylindrales bacterium]|nr:hypothetical protein [Candidatus Limnocylindrales bacterium]
MEPTTTHRLRRVGRLARRRMRIDGAELRNGIHTDGRLTVRISGLGAVGANGPETLEWAADRPIALVIVRSGVDGDAVSFQVGPLEAGTGFGVPVSDVAEIRYIAFCYDAEPDAAAAAVADPASMPSHLAPARRVVAAILGDRPAALRRPGHAGATA